MMPKTDQVDKTHQGCGLTNPMTVLSVPPPPKKTFWGGQTKFLLLKELFFTLSFVFFAVNFFFTEDADCCSQSTPTLCACGTSVSTSRTAPQLTLTPQHKPKNHAKQTRTLCGVDTHHTHTFANGVHSHVPVHTARLTGIQSLQCAHSLGCTAQSNKIEKIGRSPAHLDSKMMEGCPQLG